VLALGGAPAIDSSLGGIGGCPFAPQATGNVSTEDVVYLLGREGWATDLSMAQLLSARRWLEWVMGKQLPGLVARAGQISSHDRVDKNVYILDSRWHDHVLHHKKRPMSNDRLAGVRSDISWSSADTITVHGLDLVGDLIGSVGLGDMGFLGLRGRLPTNQESAMFNALTVCLVEHGLTPSALATRMTYFGAPESLQSAVAAGLLGLGQTFVGSMEGAARYVQEADRSTDSRDLAEALVNRFVGAGVAVPGIGHPIHRPVDPRAEKLFALAHDLGFDGYETRLVMDVSAIATRSLGKPLPVNVTGAIGAIASALGIDWRATRGIGVMARAVGLVSHVLEEAVNPISAQLWRVIDETASSHLAPPSGEAT